MKHELSHNQRIELRDKFWAWHSKRVQTATIYDLNYFELVESLIQVYQDLVIDNYVSAQNYARENAKLIQENFVLHNTIETNDLAFNSLCVALSNSFEREKLLTRYIEQKQQTDNDSERTERTTFNEYPTTTEK